MEEPKGLVNGRNSLDPREVRAAGIRYRGFVVGTGSAERPELGGDGCCWTDDMVRSLGHNQESFSAKDGGAR
jgi:hypothetical protein